MKLYVKWFYWYKNFWDEVLFFGLLNYLQEKYNPENFTIEVGDIARIQERIKQNAEFLDKWILDKIDFVENTEISKRFTQFLSFLWINRYKKYFKVFGWGEVLDENRKFPHDWWNLWILHRFCIRKWKFILVWWIWTDKQKKTQILCKTLFSHAKEIICREATSVERVKKYWIENVIKYQDFSKTVFEKKDCAKLKWKKVVLINISPKYFNEKNIEKIKKFIENYYSDYKKIYFPADINFDKTYYSEIRKHIPDLQIYDWTKHKLQETIELFQDCEWWIWSRLHFLYPLKLFGKHFESLSDSDKVKKMIGIC